MSIITTLVSTIFRFVLFKVVFGVWFDIILKSGKNVHGFKFPITQGKPTFQRLFTLYCYQRKHFLCVNWSWVEYLSQLAR